MVDTKNETQNRPPEPLDSPARNKRSKGSSAGIICALLVAAVVVVACLYWNKKAAVTDLGTKLSQANSDNSQLRSDLDKANANLADVRHQLDASNAQAADLKAQLASAASRQAALDSDLKRARADLSSLKQSSTQAETASNEQLQKATDDAANLRKQLEQAKSESADLSSQLASAQSALQKATPPPETKQEVLPVSATFDKALFGSHYTMHLKDTGSGPLEVTVSVNGSARPATKIQAGATADIGDLKAGDTVQVSSAGFQPVSQTVK